MSASAIAKRLAREPAWIVFGLTAIYYLLTLASGVLWMDVGELATAAFHLGGAHPPGHPGHSLLGKLATLLPIGEVATRLSFLSALAAAAALAGVSQLTLTLLPGQRVLAVLVVVPMALSPALLVNATRPEVYTATFALLAWAMVFALRFTLVAPHRARDALVAVFLLGLAASFHPVIAATVALPLAISLVATAGRRCAALAPLALALTVLAALLYLYLPMRALAAQPPELMWGDPSNLDRLYQLVSASVYQGNLGGGELAERLAQRLALLAEGTGFVLSVVGCAGLGFGALTRLRGAGLLLGITLVVPIAGAVQSAFNPDMRAYLAMAYVGLSVGVAIVAVALTKTLPSSLFSSAQRRWATAVAVAPVLIFALRAEPGEAQELDSTGDAMRLWDETIGSMPPGPGVFFASGDHLLFVAQYEALVAGARPDIAIATPQLVRDRWFLDHLRHRLPANDLFLPYLDDGRKGQIAERLYWENSKRGRPVWADVPSPVPAHARAEGRAFALLAEAPQVPDEPPLPPLSFSGFVGRRIAGLVALRRARYEAARGRLAWAASAAGIESRFPADALQGKARHPSLLAYIPILTERFLYDESERALLADDIRFQLGLDIAKPNLATPEQQIHFAWRLLLAGEIERGNAALRAIGGVAEASTTPMLVAIGELALAEKRLRLALAHDPRDAPSLAMLGSLLGNQNQPATLSEAQELFERASTLDPTNAETWTRLGLVYVKLGKPDKARAAWQEALRLAPARGDVQAYLQRLSP